MEESSRDGSLTCPSGWMIHQLNLHSPSYSSLIPKSHILRVRSCRSGFLGFAKENVNRMYSSHLSYVH